MADDIVTRLRSENRMALAPFHMSDAADEIERLLAENERLRAAGDAMAEARSRQAVVTPDPLLDAWQEARREQ